MVDPLQGANKLDHYPSLTDLEFEEGCRGLEARCCDNLEGTNWLSVRWRDNALEIKQKGFLGVRQTLIANDKDIEEERYDERDEGCIGSDEDIDSVIIRQPITDRQHHPAVDFSIVLSPTYRVPVLWFSLSSVKIARVSDLDEIYASIAAAGSHEALRGVGVIGGISLANHPVTDVPMFFVHPCNTPDAMVALNDGSSMDPLRYLFLWFGIVGAGLGLHVPSKVAA